MGLNFIGVSRDYQEPLTKGNPNPYKFIILNSEEVHNHLIVKIKYPDCSNYEGIKILVYKNYSLKEMMERIHKGIDPHFSENKELKSPFARFEPSQKGWEAARQLVEIL